MLKFWFQDEKLDPLSNEMNSRQAMLPELYPIFTRCLETGSIRSFHKPEYPGRTLAGDHSCSKDALLRGGDVQQRGVAPDQIRHNEDHEHEEDHEGDPSLPVAPPV